MKRRKFVNLGLVAAARATLATTAQLRSVPEGAGHWRGHVACCAVALLALFAGASGASAASCTNTLSASSATSAGFDTACYVMAAAKELLIQRPPTGGGGTRTRVCAAGTQPPPPAAAAGLTKLAFCDDFSTDSVARGDTAEARDITAGKKWTTERATGWGGTPDPATAFRFNTDGTLTVQPTISTYNWFMSSTVLRNGALKGFWINKKAKWYAEIRWKFQKGTASERQPAFWSMDTCHLYGLPATCPSANREYVESDFWEYVDYNSQGLHYYQEAQGNAQHRNTCGGKRTESAGPGENTYFTAGHLYGGETTQVFYKNDVAYYTRGTNETCKGKNGAADVTSGFILKKMLVGDYPILIGSKPGEIITIDYVRVWLAP